ncbi:MAG: hypothetical protein CM15mV148_140 [uncultured marine virus]|nr:MAG: hypothetical protein CM15mV148_140 [uncultured marine virus]
MAEADAKLLGCPIPGQSLTAEPALASQQPKQYTTVEEALDYYLPSSAIRRSVFSCWMF